MSEEYDADQIIAKREALAACPPGHADRGDLAGTLSYALCVYYRQTLDIALITEAIGVGREALALRPPGHPERVLSCGNLAHALLAYYDYTNDAALLDEAIALDREALGLRPHDHPERSTACANLASSLRTRYQQTEDIALLDEVISLEREALGLRPAGHPSRVYSCGNLATSLHIKHRRSQDIALLDEAIKLYREALALRAVGHPDRGVTCANLAVSLQTFYQRTGDTTHLDEAIELEREALHLCPHNHPFRALSCENLAGSLYTRYQQTGDTTLLDESIGLEREALAARPKDHPDHPRGCIHLADSLHRRYRQTGEAALLDEAIDLSREALSLRPQGHLERAYCCTNLANTLMTRFRQTGEAALLDELVALEREGLALRPLDDPARVGALESLASSLCTYCQQTGNVTLLDEVADLCNEAQQQDSSAYVWRPWITMCRLHLIRNSPHHSVMKAAQCLLQSFQSQVVDDTQLYMSNISRSLPLFWASFDVWTFQTTILLISIYTNVIDRLPLIAGFVLDPSTQLKTLKAFSQVGSDACVIGLLADLSTTAVELLDCAHGVVWAQALNQRNPDMEGAPPELTGALKKALHGIVIPTSATQGEPTNSYLTSQDVRHAQNGRVQTILREIRALPGHQHFMLRKTYETLREAAREHPVVLLVTSRGHSFALVMANAHEEQPHMLRLSLTSEDLTSLGNSAEQAGLCSRADTRDSNSGTRLGLQARETHLNSKPLRVLTDIWHKIVKPVIVHLRLEKSVGRSRTRLHWCPNGSFVFLPLHAAGIYKGPPANQVCCSDYVVSSYTPTISALLRAQARATSIASSDVSMLLVGEDCASVSGMTRLWNVGKELTSVESVAKTKQFGRSVETIASAATVERIGHCIQSASFVHLACHGIQHRTNALESGFYLSDGVLTISKLMALELGRPWFGYLSACETAKGDAEQPDQVMHLAAAMLFAGFKSVVATMWTMNDSDGPDMAEWFYEELMSSKFIDTSTVAYALDAAVQKLRAKEPSPKRWAQFIHMGA